MTTPQELYTLLDALGIRYEKHEQTRWRCHPLVNSATVVIGREGVEAFLAHTGHAPRVTTVR